MYTYNYICSCNRLHLSKSCLCCFLDIHSYSNSLSSVTKFSLLIKSELFPACFSCSSKFIQSKGSSRFDGKNNVCEIKEGETIKPGDFGNFIIVRSRVDLIPGPLTSKCIYFAKSYKIFYPIN